MRIYLADEKCRECDGRATVPIWEFDDVKSNETCSRCNGVGLEPRELTQVGVFSQAEEFHSIEEERYEGDDPVYRMEDVKE